MKTMKFLAAAALALSFAGCTSQPDNAEVEKDQDKVVEEDAAAVDKANEEDKVVDENGGKDADYGTPESSDETNEVPTTAEEQQAPEQAENVETAQD